MRRLRELGISEAEEIGGFSLRSFRFPSYRTVGVLRMKGLRVPRLRYSWSLRLGKFGLSAGAILGVPQAEGNWGYFRYLGISALGQFLFLWVKELVVTEADETRAPFRLGPGLLKADGIWGLQPVLGSSPSRMQGNPQDERRRRMRKRVRQSSGLNLKFIFARLLYTLNNVFWGEVHIAYTQGISKHYSNLTFNRNRMSPTYFFIHNSLSYHLAFRLANILWLAPGVT